MLIRGLKEIPLLDSSILRKDMVKEVPDHIAKGLIKMGYAEKEKKRGGKKNAVCTSAE